MSEAGVMHAGLPCREVRSENSRHAQGTMQSRAPCRAGHHAECTGLGVCLAWCASPACTYQHIWWDMRLLQVARGFFPCSFGIFVFSSMNIHITVLPCAPLRSYPVHHQGDAWGHYDVPRGQDDCNAWCSAVTLTLTLTIPQCPTCSHGKSEHSPPLGNN